MGGVFSCTLGKHQSGNSNAVIDETNVPLCARAVMVARALLFSGG
jgi:hypothetical protein